MITVIVLCICITSMMTGIAAFWALVCLIQSVKEDKQRKKALHFYEKYRAQSHKYVG